MTLLTWAGIALCLSQSAMFSGLNLAFFTLSRLDLELAERRGEPGAGGVRRLRADANFLLVTILWGNVSVNVLLALLAGSVLTGVWAFLFSTVAITAFGEILPQAWFSRHALRVAVLLTPVVRAYQTVLYPVARPTALMLDAWLGPEAIRYVEERDLRHLIRFHMDAATSDIARVEGQGALNFLALDDLPLAEEGEPLDPRSIITLPFEDGQPVFPSITGSIEDALLAQVQASGKKWVVVADTEDRPRFVLDADEFLRDALFHAASFRPQRHLHRPIVIHDGRTPIGNVITSFQVAPFHSEDDVVDRDVILLWSEQRRIVTGADVLGRLLRGIVRT